MQTHVTRPCTPGLRRAWLLITLAGGCTMPNPAFDLAGGSKDLSDSDGESGDGDSGDGDPGDGDGDPGDGDGEPGDGDGEPGDGDGEPGECAPPLTDCLGACVDLDTSLEHCGGCESPCRGGCQNGTCDESAKRVVFVASQPITGQMGGLEGADGWCMELAGGAGLEGEFKAWLSTAEIGPAIRMTHFSGPYRLADGTLIANDWQDLTDGTLAHAIDLDESGEPISPPAICEGHEVWTNTKPDGSPSSSNDCGGWQGTTHVSMAGQYTAVDGSWTQSSCTQVNCVATLPLYCVQQ